jgi:hypothetical protein
MRTTVQVIGRLLVAAAISGCASVSVKRVTNDYGSAGIELGADDGGVRFFRPALHVWITSNPPSDKINVAVDEKSSTTTQGKDTLTKKSTATLPATVVTSYSASLVMLPDYSQEYVIQWKAGSGAVKPQFALADGWNLTSFTSDIDSKTAENIGAISGAITSVAGAAAGALVNHPNFRGPGLYRLEISKTGRYSLGEQVLGL